MLKKLIIIFLFSLSFPLFCDSYEIVKDECNLSIDTPSLQNRKFLKIRLKNGLEAYLVSDPDAPKSAAALAVHVGSWSDPEDRPGLAHFLEHLLFLGTEKYPHESGYTKYLDQYGGQRNAFTASDRTVYMFSIDNEGFKGALDRFAQFFIAPLFLTSGIDREMKAIDQEFCKDQPLDTWRHHYVMKELANPKHPFHRFDIGNKETLKAISRDEVKEWYHTHYSADIMKLVVISPLPTAEMAELVSETFAPVSKKTSPPLSLPDSLFTPDKLNRVITITPLRALQTLDFTWELPPLSKKEEEMKVQDLLAFILGNEGDESLLVFLKERGWADGIRAGDQKLSSTATLLTVSIELTCEGLNHIDEIIHSMDQTLTAMRKGPIQPELFQEIQAMALIKYRYQTRGNVFEQVAEWAYNLVDEPLATFPKNSLIPFNYNPDLIEKVLKHFIIENAFITLNCDKEKKIYKNAKSERWMGVSYAIHSPILLKNTPPLAFNKKIIPESNPFISTQLLPIKREFSDKFPEPVTLIENSQGKLFFAEDSHFLTPEVSYSFVFKSPLINDHVKENVVMGDLFCKIVLDEISPLIVHANQAGIHSELATQPFNIQLDVKGYSDKTSLFLKEVLQKFNNGPVSIELFERNKDKLIRKYHNAAQSSPLKQGMDELYHILYKDRSTYGEKEELLQSISYEKFQDFHQKLFEQSYIEALFFGDITKEHALQIWSDTIAALHSKPYPASKHFQIELAALKLIRGPYLFSKKSKLEGNALILTADLGPFNFKTRASQEILSKSMEEPFFSELRTRQQTAYIVTNWAKELERELYSFFAIQSHSHDGRDLLARFELFIENFLQNIRQEVTAEKFEILKNSSIYALDHPYKDRDDLIDLLKTLAFDYDGDFEWLKKRKAALKELTYSEFIQFAADSLGSENHQRLAIFIEGKLPGSSLLNYKKVNFKKLKNELEYQTRFQRN